MGTSTTEQLNQEIAGTREDLAKNLNELGDKVSPGRIVARRKQAVRGRFSSMRDAVMGSAHDVADHARSGVDSAGSITSNAGAAVQGVGAQARHQAQGSPLAAGLIAFGVGAVAAALVPASRREAELAHQASEAAKEHGSPVLEQVKSAAQEVGEHAKEQVQEAAQEIGSTAKESASRVQDEGRSAASTVKDDATS